MSDLDRALSAVSGDIEARERAAAAVTGDGQPQTDREYLAQIRREREAEHRLRLLGRANLRRLDVPALLSAPLE